MGTSIIRASCARLLFEKSEHILIFGSLETGGRENLMGSLRQLFVTVIARQHGIIAVVVSSR